ncbi:potassium channel protein [candidate division KSB1 bacterium]|nr:potassium channel protein [candidate division KSB1 bacterium]
MGSKRQLLVVLSGVLLVIILGSIGYKLVAEAGMSWIDSFYHTLLTITSIGYTDTGYGNTPVQKIFGVIFMAMSLISLSITGAAFVAFFTETKIHKKVWEIMMARKMKYKRSHMVLIGVNKVAPYIITEFLRTKTPFCVISQDEEVIANLIKEHKDLIIFHHPSKHFTEKIFEQVQLKNADKVILDLGNDEINYITSDLVREYNPDIKLLAVGDDMTYMPVMSKRMNHVVNPHNMCAMRLASLAKRPAVVNHLDRMLYKKDGVYRIEEVEVTKKSTMVNMTLQELDLPHNLKLCVVELMSPVDDHFESNFLPLPEDTIEQGMKLCVQGEVENIELLRDVADGTKSWREINKGASSSV